MSQCTRSLCSYERIVCKLIWKPDSHRRPRKDHCALSQDCAELQSASQCLMIYFSCGFRHSNPRCSIQRYGMRYLLIQRPMLINPKSLPILQRLLNRDSAENASRHTTFVEQVFAQADGHVVKLSDPWGIVRRAAKGNGLLDSLRWLRLFARSGVDIDVPIFAEYSELSRKGLVTLEQASVFAEATLMSVWTKSMGRQDLQKSISTMIGSLQPAIKSALRSSSDNASWWVSGYYYLYCLITDYMIEVH